MQGEEGGSSAQVSLTLTTTASELPVFGSSQGILLISSGEPRRYVSRVGSQSSSVHDTPGTSTTVVDLAILD